MAGEVIVSLRSGALDALPSLHLRDGLQDVRFEVGPWAGPNLVVVLLRPKGKPAGRVSKEATRALAPVLAQQPEFTSVDLNYLEELHAVPNDPHFGLMWHLDQLHMDSAWEITTGSSNVVVAVLDTGVQRHEDLGDRLLPGYDMISDPSRGGDGDGRDPDASPVPGHAMSWHGQHVAGTIAADSNNGVGITGMDWNARILPVRVIAQNGTSADIIAGIYWAIGAEVPGLPLNPHPADVLNMSLGGGGLSYAKQQAIDAANAAGAIVVVSAGNDDKDAGEHAFSGLNGVITVGATDFRGRRASYSNWGKAVTVLAPGGDTSADRNSDGRRDGVFSLSFSWDGRQPTYRFAQGTSMAAPHVSGLVALMKALRPALRFNQVKQILQETARPTAHCPQGCGAGLIQPTRALQALATETAFPSLGVSTHRMNLGSGDGASIRISNDGGGILQWRATAIGAAAPTIRLERDAGELGAGQSTRLGIQVEREGLWDGNYVAGVEIVGHAVVARVAIYFSVGVDDVGDVKVFTVQYDEHGNLLPGSSTVVGHAEEYRYTLTTPAGAWFLVAWSDRNQDGAIDEGDWVGFWPETASPSTLELSVGERKEGLDLILKRPPERDSQDLPCAELRRCLEDCDWESACASACPVSDACSACYKEEIHPCAEVESCDTPGRICCASCSDRFETCLGPYACYDLEEESPPQEDRPLGSACTVPADCASPYACDTSIEQGICTASCTDQTGCPGGICVGLSETDAFCFADCTSHGVCPRNQDFCAELSNGAFACLPSGIY